MLVDISNVLDKDYFEEELNIDLNEKIFDLDNYITIKYPIKIDIIISKSLNNILFKLKCKLNYEAVCSRCLELYDGSFSIASEGNIVYRKNDEEFEENSLILRDKSVNLDEFLYQEIASSIPMKFLCREDCKGLCKKCGINLNNKNCECDKQSYDLRFEKLKDLTFD
ncbi:MAG TPA: DUF177 domain-containing protein [Soehngenia sp.]|jgi:Predicted metal-binding, possibly nucleic acid-binding protein|nr:DUF177 domain-containing protein [Soehngenia sp.]HPP30858.1 DUF177 domain-containing protein [Soehngenia sp.]